MMAGDEQSSASTSSVDDALLAELLERVTQRVRRGELPGIEQLAANHPELAEELRRLWPAVLVAEEAAVSGLHDTQPAAVAPSPGREIPSRLGDYELTEELGRGGMGVVYKARQTSLGRVVAVKTMLRGALASAEELERFRKEAEATARLEHPHIVPVYEVGELAGDPYFTMKFIAGTTLAKRLAEGPMEPREAALLLAPVCRAIDFAHQHGVLHRDLKPSNILIDEQGRPHVTDFGLAKRIAAGDSLTRTGAIVGTPSYMAPEQAADSRGSVGPLSDVYSLGAMLYQMLTGRPPFQAATAVDTVLLLLEQDPLPPRLLNPRADPDLELVALKCLQKPPDLRYRSAAALADDLEAWLADEPVSARSGLFSQVMARWFRETHQATVLENWGLLWMWHSLALLVVCLLTNAMQWSGITERWPYAVLWIFGLGTWAGIFWALRRRAGPVTFVERQIAHVWAASLASIVMLFVVETALDLPVLELSPVLALASGMVFLVKAGMLTGRFYVQAAVLFITGGVMALMQRWDIPFAISLFGIVSAACFFVPGLKYYRQRLAADEEH